MKYRISGWTKFALICLPVAIIAAIVVITALEEGTQIQPGQLRGFLKFDRQPHAQVP